MGAIPYFLSGLVALVIGCSIWHVVSIGYNLDGELEFAGYLPLISMVVVYVIKGF